MNNKTHTAITIASLLVVFFIPFQSVSFESRAGNEIKEISHTAEIHRKRMSMELFSSPSLMKISQSRNLEQIEEIRRSGERYQNMYSKL